MIRWAVVVIAFTFATQASAELSAPRDDVTSLVAPVEMSAINEFVEAMRLTIRAQQCGASVFYTTEVNRRILAGKLSGLSADGQKLLQQRVADLGAFVGREFRNKSSPPCNRTLAAFDARAMAAGFTADEISTAKERRP